MVGRSLPLALLLVWGKYRERWSADYGEEGFRDTRLAVAAGSVMLGVLEEFS